MTEIEIAESVAGHSARNHELVRLITSKGADLELARRIDLHFWAPSESSAGQLAQALRNAGLANVFHASSNGATRWNVEGQVHQPVTSVVEPQYVERFVRLAAEHAAAFDGWGTSL